MGMLGERGGTVVRDLEQVFSQGTATGLPEGDLLRRFAIGKDEAAFSTLVSRHGPMVLGVCRRILGSAPDAADAFQATFLVLLRRASSLEDVDSLGPWLHGVAWRVASRARMESARRSAEERRAATFRPESVHPDDASKDFELRALLDAEINRLPEKYRRPVVLCYLEGLSQEAAAHRLRWKAGVLRGRLDRARLRLRTRLVRLGIAPAAALAALEWIGPHSQGAVTTTLLNATLQAAIRDTTVGKVAGSLVASSAAKLAGAVLRTQFLRWTALAAALLATSTLGLAALARFGPSGSKAEQADPPRAAATPTAPSEKPVPPAGRIIDFHVVDRSSGKPLAGVRLTVIVGPVQTVDQTTDQTGAITFDYPMPRPKNMHVGTSKEGYSPMIVWVRHPNFEDEFPATYTLRMAPTTTIGGAVRDEDGRPVCGAKVSAGIFRIVPADPPPGRAEFRYGADVLTDAGGHWTCRNMPSGYDPARLSLQVQHADFQPFSIFGGKVTDAIGPKGVVVLHRGITVTGRVVDRDGRPFPGTRVSVGREHNSDRRTIETDGDGRFRLEHLPPGETVIVAQARGHGPDLVKVDVRAGLAPVELKLGPPRTIAGLVVDSQGKPIAGVWVSVSGWRGFHLALDWRTTTDADGRFRWDDAPRDIVWLSASHEGFISLHQHEVPSTAGVTRIKLNKLLMIRGTVVDGKTHKPVDSFTLTPGVDRQDDGFTYWERHKSKQPTGGKYEIRISEPSEYGHRLRVEADGYMPGISRPVADSAGDVTIDFELTAGESITGSVKLPGGQPVEGADVVLVVPSQPAFIENGRPPTGQDHRRLRSAADGRYAFPPTEKPYTVLALHDRGWAMVRSIDLAHDIELTLQPWGRVEGTVRVGTRPGAGLPLSLNTGPQGPTENAMPWFQYSANADATGRFVFDRVVPGSVTVSRKIELTEHSYSFGNMTEITVKPGATTRIALGGKGRPVIGRVVVPEGLRERLDWGYSLNQLTQKPPVLIQALGRMGLADRPTSYAVKVEPDGSFRVEDVIAGSYGLSIMLREPPSSPFRPGGIDVIATASRDLAVPEMPGGRSDEALDLGKISLTPVPPRKVIKVMEPAPGFRAETLDGKPFDLADYRGKYVLLDLWATWCGPCVAETPFLKETFEAFGKDGRFVMIGLSLDKAKDAPRTYARKNDMRWVQGFLGDWGQTKIPDSYGVNGIPAIWLVGPDGKVIARDLRGKGIKKAVAHALGQD